MTRKYTTVQGDTWDTVAYKLFADEMAMAEILQANLHYADVIVFPADVELSIPDVKKKLIETNNVPWR